MSLARRILARIARAFRKPVPAPLERPFDASTGDAPRRTYATYEEYLEHQASKLGPRLEKVAAADREYEAIVRERYRNDRDWRGARVLCLGARLGGEVRGFTALGALAVGIDVEPGPKNRFVLHGDFHAIQFADGVFDAVFCNVIDHVYELDRFFAETARVMAPGATLFLEVCQDEPHEFEVLDVRDHTPVIVAAAKFFELASDSPLTDNKAGFIDWKKGRLLRLRKR